MEVVRSSTAVLRAVHESSHVLEIAEANEQSIVKSVIAEVMSSALSSNGLVPAQVAKYINVSLVFPSTKEAMIEIGS